MRIAVGIVAHEDRSSRADRLAGAVDAVVCNVDDGTLGCAGNHIQVLHLMMPLDADWAVVLEEDAVVVPDFRFRVERALRRAPSLIVGLYLGTGNPSGQVQRQIGQAVRAAEAGNRAWITADCLIGSVGYVIRSSLITDMLHSITDRDEEYPLRVSRWAQDRSIGICYTQPSLVDHADDEPVGHPVGQERPVRKAWSFGVREEWDTPAVPLGFCNNWSQEKSDVR